MKCNKLKSITAYKLTTNTEDSDVYIHNDEFGCGGDAVQVYLKSEADKCIESLRTDYKDACGKLRTVGLIKDELYRKLACAQDQLKDAKRALWLARGIRAENEMLLWHNLEMVKRWLKVKEVCLKKIKEYE